MEKDNHIGRLLDGRYEILEVLGTGGMAVVYKAKCHRLNRMVAIKILKDEFSQDEEFRRRFHAESQAVAMLSHPNIVSIYDVSSSVAADYIVMELIDGITLKQYMEKKGVLNWKETLHFAIQIAKALEHAHGKGIVHRDIKPHNVMVLKSGAIKVMDFGIAQTLTGDGTKTKEALGSVHYISPEQAKGGRVDNRSDIYSLGIVMYEMIAGRVPYDGENPVNIALQHLNGGAQLPSVFNPNTPKGLERIIMRAMSLMPRDRYNTATAMLYDMDEFRKNPAGVLVPMTTDGDTGTIPAVEGNRAGDKTIAQQKQNHTDPVPASPRRRSDKKEERSGSNRVTTVAIASCVVVGIVALVIFLILLMQSGGGTDKVRVPDLLGMDYATLQQYEGLEIVRQSDEYSDTYEKGQIISQYPLSGDLVSPGTKIFVKVSRGPLKTMGDLVGLKQDEAERYINDMKLELQIIRREDYSNTVPAGKIIRTEPAKDAVLTKGQNVTIWISLGAEVIEEYLPNVSGYDVNDALRILEGSGFINVEINEVNSDQPLGKVLSQTGDLLVKIDVTTTIVLTVSNGIPEEPDDPQLPDDPGTSTTPTTPTQPDDPSAPTQPSNPVVTVNYSFALPERTEQYQLTIKQADAVVTEMTVQPGVTHVEVPLTGTGTAIYMLYIDGNFYSSETVDFTSYD